MAKIYDKLLAPEWFSAVRPYEFIVGVIKALRTLTARIMQFTGLSLKHTVLRPYYQTISVPNANVGRTVVEGGVVYSLSLPIKDLDLIGIITPKTAIRGKDFVFVNNVYKFTVHPSTFGTVTNSRGTQFITFVGVGGSPTTQFDPLGVGYHNCTDAVTRDAITDGLSVQSPLGLTPRLLEAIAGARLATDKLTAVWSEGRYIMGLTDKNELVYAPSNSGLVFKAGWPIDTSKVLSDFDNTFYAKLPNGHYIVNLGTNQVADYPGIEQYFPTLKINNGQFVGADLLIQLKAAGYTFYHWQRILDNGQHAALSYYQINPGKTAISITAAPATPTAIEYTPTADSQPTWVVTSHASAYNYS